MALMHRELTVSSKANLEQSFRKERSPFSEKNFSNLYLYQEAHEWQVVVDGSEKICGVTGTTYDHKKVFLPLQEKALISDLDEDFLKSLINDLNVEQIYPLNELTARFLSLKGYKISYEIADGDYIMSRERIAEYPGRALDGKRNLVHQFTGAGEASIKKLSKETLQDAQTILTEWTNLNPSTPKSEQIASYKGIREQAELGIEGWIAYLDGSPMALCYGAPLTDSIYLIHCAKAIRKEIKGSLPYLHQEVAKRLPQQYTEMNWEQDLGVPGLRQAKLAYEPTTILAKWRAHIYTQRS